MTTTQLQSALRAQPFRPFALRIADGRAQAREVTARPLTTAEDLVG